MQAEGRAVKHAGVHCLTSEFLPHSAKKVEFLARPSSVVSKQILSVPPELRARAHNPVVLP